MGRPLPEGAEFIIVCNHCLGPVEWPCVTASYAYTAEARDELREEVARNGLRAEHMW